MGETEEGEVEVIEISEHKRAIGRITVYNATAEQVTFIKVRYPLSNVVERGGSGKVMIAQSVDFNGTDNEWNNIYSEVREDLYNILGLEVNK